MIIPVTFDSAGSSTASKLPPALAKISHDEVVLIEMQGAIEVETATPQEKNGKLVGRLQLDEATNKSTLIIGNHLLEGKLVSIPKPLAILHRTTSPLESDLLEDPETAVASWESIAIVKRKIVFSKRPMPLTAKPGAKPAPA